MTVPRRPRYIVESIELDSWSAVVRGDECSAVFGSATANVLQPGPGPGDLAWERGCDGGLPALRATWGTGHFLILPVSSSLFALFFALPERDQPLAVGSVEGLKHTAAVQQTSFAAPPPTFAVPPSPTFAAPPSPTFAAPPPPRTPPVPAPRPVPAGPSKAIFLKGLITR